MRSREVRCEGEKRGQVWFEEFIYMLVCKGKSFKSFQ